MAKPAETENSGRKLEGMTSTKGWLFGLFKELNKQMRQCHGIVWVLVKKAKTRSEQKSAKTSEHRQAQKNILRELEGEKTCNHRQSDKPDIIRGKFS